MRNFICDFNKERETSPHDKANSPPHDYVHKSTYNSKIIVLW